MPPPDSVNSGLPFNFSAGSGPAFEFSTDSVHRGWISWWGRLISHSFRSPSSLLFSNVGAGKSSSNGDLHLSFCSSCWRCKSGAYAAAVVASVAQIAAFACTCTEGQRRCKWRHLYFQWWPWFILFVWLSECAVCVIALSCVGRSLRSWLPYCVLQCTSFSLFSPFLVSENSCLYVAFWYTTPFLVNGFLRSRLRWRQAKTLTWRR